MDIRIAIAIVVTCMPLRAMAAQNEPAIPQESRPEPEEIVIVGERNLRLLMMESEKRAYEVFNQFNDEKRFNISCSINAPTGSHFVRQVCQPQFESDVLSEQGQSYLEGLYTSLGQIGALPGGGLTFAHPSLEAEMARQRPAYTRKMKEVAEQHPEFLNAIIQYGKIRRQYEAASSTPGK